MQATPSGALKIFSLHRSQRLPRSGFALAWSPWPAGKRSALGRGCAWLALTASSGCREVSWYVTALTWRGNDRAAGAAPSTPVAWSYGHQGDGARGHDVLRDAMHFGFPGDPGEDPRGAVGHARRGAD